jgi:hypothetical protein
VVVCRQRKTLPPSCNSSEGGVGGGVLTKKNPHILELHCSVPNIVQNAYIVYVIT